MNKIFSVFVGLILGASVAFGQATISPASIAADANRLYYYPVATDVTCWQRAGNQ